MNIAEYLRNSAIIPTKSVMYVYADAFTVCECGRNLQLTQKSYGDARYTGECECGKKWTLIRGKMF